MQSTKSAFICLFVVCQLPVAPSLADGVGEVPAFSSGERPLVISSWHGNNFGVVAELRGTYRLEAGRLTVTAESFRLKQVVSCHYGCVTIRAVQLGIHGDSGPKTFSTYARSEPLAVGRRFDESAVLDLGRQEFVLNLNAETPLIKSWIGIEISNDKGGTYYAHTARNFFAQEFARLGWAPDACDAVRSDAQAIKTGCNAALGRELNHWARPLKSMWGKLTGETAPVWIALQENNVEAIQMLNDHGEDIDPPGKGGETPLMLAAANGSTNMVRALLRNGANPNYTIRSGQQAGRTALNGAISARSPETVAVLLKHGARFDKPDEYGWLPVHYAVYYDSLESLRVLSEHGADLDANAPGQRGETPLMVAAQYAKLPAIRLLLESGVDRSRLDRHQKNALDYAEFFRKEEAAALLRNTAAANQE